jgi:O-antigen/teichoic acid export membrane protein
VFARNVGLSTVVKFSSFLLQFAMLPLLVKSLGKSEYGVWVALQSLVVWIALLELGIGKGLRNKLIESLSLGETGMARRYISSTFFGQLVLWGAVAVGLGLLLLVVDFPWARWLRSSGTDRSIAWSLLFCFISFSLSQLFGVTSAILYAKHWNAATSLVGFFGSLGVFLYVLYSSWIGVSLSMPELAFANLLLFALGYAIQSSYLFRQFPELLPTWGDASWRDFYEIVSIGIRFLLIEITFIVIFVMDRWIVLQWLGPVSVTEYDILLKFSALVTTGYSLCIGPIWALSGTAWAKRDVAMMDRLWRIVSAIMIPFALVALVIGFAMNPVIHLWVDEGITIPPLARWSMVVYSWIVIWGSAYASLLNGIGRVREQMICSVVACLMNIPLAMYLSGIGGIGIAGVLIASALSLSMFAVVAPFVWFECRNRCEPIA